MFWRKEMDLQDLAIELFRRFDPDHRGYITQDQLLDSVNDNIFSEGQIISVFALLDKEDKGIITLSDFTDAFVDISVNQNDSEIIQESTDLDDRYRPTRSSDDHLENRLNSLMNGLTSSEKCECPCSKSNNCLSNLKIKCCKYDRTLKRYKSSEFLNDFIQLDKRHGNRQLGTRKHPLVRRESSPNIVMGTRVDVLKSNLFKSKRWKSYDYGMNCCDTLNEELEEMNLTNDKVNANGNVRNGIGNKYESTLCSDQTISYKIPLCSSRSSAYHSDTNLDKRSKDITEEFDEIFGTCDGISNIGCNKCKSNRKISTSDYDSRRRINYDFNDNVFNENGFSDENSNYHNYRNSFSEISSNVKRKLCYENDNRNQNSGILQNSKLYHSGRKKNGFIPGKNSIPNGDGLETSEGDALLEEEWGSYLRRIGAGPLFSGNLTLQYLWQQIKLYQSELVFPFDKFLKSIIEEQRSVYAKCHETESTLHLKIEQHEKEISNLYEEFDIAREKEVKKLEIKQHEREEYLKGEFRKIIDYKEQAYQECCRQMAHINERLESYEEEISSLQLMKKKAEEQCKFLLEEQQRYLAENQHVMLENEILKQKYKACKSSINDMQDHLNQLKEAAEEERGRHRSFMQQYNDIVDEKSFLETSLANLSSENVELRNLKRSQLTPEEKPPSIVPTIPSIEFNDLTDFPLCASSPVKHHLLENVETSQPAISLHEELDTSDTENNELTPQIPSISSKMTTHKSLMTELNGDVSITSGKDTISRYSDDKRAVREKNKECFNITHHFIACDKLSISKHYEESLEVLNKSLNKTMNKSILSYSDPLIKNTDQIDLAKKKIEASKKQDKIIHLAAPFKSEFKIIFCGDSNVGKTSLIYRICFGYFRHSFHKDTVEVDTFVKNVETVGQTFKLKIWDTVGQERYNSVPHSYYRKSDVAIIMYDITKEISFANVKTWLENINKYSDNILRIVIGNKIDLNDSRRVLKQRGEQFAKANDAVFVETSAKSGENIERLLYLLTTKLLDQNEFVLIQNYFEQSTMNESTSKKQCCN